jgi:hypothetical protein
MDVERARKSFENRVLYETACVLAAALLLAGVWGGALYQGETFTDALLVGTLGVVSATLTYAVMAKRWLVLLAVPLFAGAVVMRELLIGFLFVAFPALLPAFVPALVRRTRWRRVVFSLTVSVVGATIGALFLYVPLQEHGVRVAVERGNRIVEAIDRYRTVEGRLPGSLDDLLPRELDSIPETGMIGFPSFRYLVGTTDGAVGGKEPLYATYELRVNLFKLVKFDSLVYWPEGNYPDVMYGGGVRRVGDWAFVNE